MAVGIDSDGVKESWNDGVSHYSLTPQLQYSTGVAGQRSVSGM